jgi:hypothetical protein
MVRHKKQTLLPRALQKTDMQQWRPAQVKTVMGSLTLIG